MDAEKKLTKVKTQLVLGHPFFGSVALNMHYRFDSKLKHLAATDGKTIVVNPEKFAQLTHDEAMFLIAHECMHPMLDHNWRRGSRSPKRWNIACDYAANELLTLEKIGTMPKGGYRDSHLYNQCNGVVDSIYNQLPDDDDGGGDGDDGGDGFDDCQDAEGTPAEKSQSQQEMKIMVAQAAQAAKMQGKLSANMQRLVDEVLEPKVDWRDVLQRFLQKAKTDSRTYARFNRRFLPQGLYLPSISGEQMGDLVFAVDCSGSIDDRQVSQFAAEIRVVKEDLMPSTIHVVYFDSEVTHTDSYGPDDILDIKPHGGGGTDFAPVFAKIEDMAIEPVAIVFLTDLYCSSFGNMPDAPVLWVTTGATEAPFGEIVKMEA